MTVATLSRTTLVPATALLAVFASGCTQGPEPTRGSTASAVAFTEQFYYDMLSGKPGACEVFTDEGRADFVADMQAADCESAAATLGNSIGPNNVDTFTASNTYTLEGATETTVVVRADFTAFGDLMTLEWVEGEWRVGPTRRIPGSDDLIPSGEQELPGDHNHNHNHDHKPSDNAHDGSHQH